MLPFPSRACQLSETDVLEQPTSSCSSGQAYARSRATPPSRNHDADLLVTLDRSEPGAVAPEQPSHRDTVDGVRTGTTYRVDVDEVHQLGAVTRDEARLPEQRRDAWPLLQDP